MKKEFSDGEAFHKKRDRLLSIIRFELFKASGKNICWRCGNPIEKHDEMTLDHVIPWRDKPRDEAIRLLKDKNNIKFAHPQCNLNDTVEGKSGYIGVIYHKNGIHKPWQARFSAKNKKNSLKYWASKEQAAMKRDLYAFKYYNGCCRLNFEKLKNFYQENINKDWSFLENETAVKQILDGIL